MDFSSCRFLGFLVILHHFELSLSPKRNLIFKLLLENLFFSTNKTKLQPTNQPINQSHRLFLSSSWSNPSTPSIHHQIQASPAVSPASFTNHHPRYHGKLLIKISIRKEQKKQTKRIAATKSATSFLQQLCNQASKKKPNTTKKQKTPKSFRPQTPPPERRRRQKKVPKARELRVKKKTHKA
jgi:hypothetical protein